MVLIPEVAFVSSVVLSMLGGHCAVCNSSLSPAARPVAFSRTIANTDSTCFDLVWICYTTNLQQFVLRRTHNANRQQNRKPETNPENNPTTCCPTNKRHIQVVEVWRNTDLPGFKISCKSVYGGFSANRWNIRKHFYLCVYFFFRNSHTGQTPGRILARDGSNDAASRNGVPFGGYKKSKLISGPWNIPPKSKFRPKTGLLLIVTATLRQ